MENFLGNTEILSKIKDVYSCSEKEGRLLYKLAQQCTGKGVIVEIGSWKGYSTIWLASGSKTGNSIPVYAVDTFEGDKLGVSHGEPETYQEFMRNVTDANVRDVITVMAMPSEIASKVWDNKPIEFIFIDGDHDDIEADFSRWYPHVIEGGIMALHDTVAWPSMIPWKVAKEELYLSGKFKDVKRVGAITYGTKTSRLTFRDKDKNLDALLQRYIYQLVIPYYTKCLVIGGKILGRS